MVEKKKFKFKFKSEFEFELRMVNGLFPAFSFSLLAHALALSLPQGG